jgi:hypothetical protein
MICFKATTYSGYYQIVGSLAGYVHYLVTQWGPARATGNVAGFCDQLIYERRLSGRNQPGPVRGNRSVARPRARPLKPSQVWAFEWGGGAVSYRGEKERPNETDPYTFLP